MRFIADFHIHSKYSRATSPQMEVPTLSRWAQRKGIQVLGTGDFTHPAWMKELEATLEPSATGLHLYDGISFILTAEISLIYSKNGRGYRNHVMLFAPSFSTAKKINAVLGSLGNLLSDGRPILGLDSEELARVVFDIDAQCVLVPAHIWTPWFSLFGSKSGFDRLEDCFGKQSEKIFCLETGLSSDPAMNWRLSTLDRYALISNSDSHSPQKIGREANVFDTELTYEAIMAALRSRDRQKFLYTIEFFPEEGKYHFDGHRACGVRFSPEQTKAHGGICPQCGKPLTVGVMNRVAALADRPEGFVPPDAIPFKHVISLDEMIADVFGVAAGSRRVWREYDKIVQTFGTEWAVLQDADEPMLRKALLPELAEAIVRMRCGKVSVLPGFDGEYGRISVARRHDTPPVHQDAASGGKKDKQLDLF